MHKKGQAAMEFLMTYGWAILAAIIAIGVLAYFGVFSPGSYVTGSAIVNPPFYVNALNVKVNTVNLELKNNGGENFNVTSVVINPCGSYATPTPIALGSTVAFTVSCGSALNPGESFKGDITITYRKFGSSLDLTSTGTIAEKVTA